ncbi:hypothetical protein [Flavobacterium sp. GT3R68]|uniref:hypothetical protein n=1 Tax=Flavobacterium sp. GT3R68 TaxID=2594437 RepID=UPI000F886B62|nr:hypothetical protein [Flavobacterium sp. GT3R68]RTY89319.1 hypothetical protein EKL32_22955 [Flavobacterium sp. GSN2]TRW93879.1 hypothetical protein FNW07_02930 [Flavobacterium sp. GT3R68]
MEIPKKTSTTKKTILLFFFFSLNILTYGQKKTPIIQHISSYIITKSDTIKVQRLNGTEYHKLMEFESRSDSRGYYWPLLDAVRSIEGYLEARSKGEIPDNPNDIEVRFNNLTQTAKAYSVYFDLENYKKESFYYKIQEEKTKERIKEHNEQTKREEELKRQRISDMLLAKKKNDSIFVIERRQGEIKDSIEYIKQKKINEAKEKERRKQDVKIKIAQKKHEIEKQTKSKLENEKKKNQRREDIINKYGLENGEAILNHKVKIGWTKSMCIASWGKPRDINRTTTPYGNHEQYVYSLKKYLYFENGILITIQD